MKLPLDRLRRLFQPKDARRDIDFRALTENAADVVLLVSSDLQLRYASPSSKAVLGWEPEEILAMQLGMVYEPDLPLVHETAEKLLASGAGSDISLVLRANHKDGSLRWMEGHGRLLANEDPHHPNDVVVTLRDVSAMKELQERLSALAMEDGLTGLANRRAFDEALHREWDRTLRDRSRLSLVLIDLDLFKEVNDRFGHQVGDDCLRSVAATLRGVARRPGDLAARYGGEELALILPDTDMNGAEQLAEELRQAIYDLDLSNPGNAVGDRRMTASIGVATAQSSIGGTMKMPEALLLAADAALYRSKHEGRNRVTSTMLLVPEGEG
ncbi:sensor domain-containing diguanylate cyclase [Pseudoroseicyclus sp. H15]